MVISLIIWVLFVHFVADFICQDDFTATNKSKFWDVLLGHSIFYFIILVFGLAFYDLVSPLKWSILFAINAPAHLVIDFFTSRINAKLYEDGERHWFFVVLGADQFFHTAILFLTIQ